MAVNFEEDPGWKYLRLSIDEIIKNQTKPFDSKKNVWIADTDEGFIEAEIKSIQGEMATVFTTRGMEVTIKKDQCLEMNPPKYELTEDMANLTFLNEAAVLHNLRQRYYKMMIYTYSGLFCVVINPYKRLPIYSESVIKMYLNRRRTELPPHLFAVSDEAYRNMVLDRENQSMLITGESGAGKTENTKKVISYFAIVGSTQQKDAVGPDGKKKPTLEDQIVQTNPVLEAFGNAKTVRNNNSSRFGKFIRTHFSKEGKLAGGDIEHYLLEKSRVIKQAPGERCYHIFYMIQSEGISGMKGKLCLDQDMRYYHFCSQAELTIDGVDDAAEMRATDEAFDIMGFSEQEKWDMYKLTAAVMHMGEMKFLQRPREENAQIDENKIDAVNACKLFGVDPEAFLLAFVKPRVRVGNEWVNKGQNLDQVHWAMGALAKAIYARMFHWLIKRCNKTLDAQDLERKFFIGVLDIAGFEIFDLNSFEQQWINFVNEKLQQFFNHHMFVLEQEEYEREGIQWEFIDFGLDLQQCIELIEKPMGIISILDEECIVPKATDMTFAQKLNDTHLGKHPNFQKPKPPKGKQSEAHFAVVHYAGTVRYNANNWLEKNKDPLNDTAVSVLKTSTENQLLQDIWEDYQTQEEAADIVKAGGTAKKKGKSSSFMTVSMMYRESLNNLMFMLNQTHPHFIRCIIPNELKQSALLGVLDAALTLNQLTCNGVLEGIRICRKGFPNRQLYPDFKQRYGLLAADAVKAAATPKAATDGVMKAMISAGHMKPEDFRLGETKIFFKAGVLANLEDIRDQTMKSIITAFQSHIRSYLGKTSVQRLKEQTAASKVVQGSIREWLENRNWKWFKLLARVRPLCKNAQFEEELAKLTGQVNELEGVYAKELKLRADLSASNARLQKEKENLAQQIQSTAAALGETGDRLSKLERAKAELERAVEQLGTDLIHAEDAADAMTRDRKLAEQESESLKKRLQDLEMALKKAESERVAKEHQIRLLQDEIKGQDESVAKQMKEKRHQEELSRKANEDLQNEDDHVNHMSKLNAKLQATVDEAADQLEREKRLRQEAEKQKRKLEGDVKVVNENLDEIEKQKRDIETSLKRKEQELQHASIRLEDEQSTVAKLERMIKEVMLKMDEVEEELSLERGARSKAESARSSLQQDLEDLGARLEEAGSMTAMQIELNKKRDAEVGKLRRDLEEQKLNNDEQLNGLRRKYQDAVADLTEQLEQLQKAKSRLDKEKVILQREVEELRQTHDRERKAKIDADNRAKNLETELAENQAKVDQQNRELADFSVLKNRMNAENGELLRQLEEAEATLANLLRIKQQLASQAEDARNAASEQTKEKQMLKVQLGTAEHEHDKLRDYIEEELTAKNDLQRQLSKAHGDVQQWKARFETEGLARIEEFEEQKRKITERTNELIEQIEQANAKVVNLEKQRSRLMGDLDDAQVEIERAKTYAQSLELKQKGFEKFIEGWHKKCDDLRAELDASQTENRCLGTEVFRLKGQCEELNEGVEGVRRENRNLNQEIKDLADQLGEGGRAIHDLQKNVRRLEVEKEELQQAADATEAALEAEEQKVFRAQMEVAQIRQEVEKRIREKEEEFENKQKTKLSQFSTKRNHQRALESLQATLETEAKARNEALRIKKNLETNINELEIAMDHANKANAEAQKNIKRYIEQVRELQLNIEEEQRQRDELRDQLSASEKRAQIAQTERDEITHQIESLDRIRRQLEQESLDTRNQFTELTAQNSALTALKRKLEAEILNIQNDIADNLKELRASEERSKKFMMDAAGLAEELRQEQEHSQGIDRLRRGLEDQIRQMQAALDDAETNALKGGKRLIEKLEQRIKELEQEVASEQRRHQDTEKNFRKQERQLKEVEFQLDEDRKSGEKAQELVDTLQTKMRLCKRQIEEAEEVAAMNLGKYRQLQQSLEDAIQRGDVAENSLAKMRAKSRIAAQGVTGEGGPGYDLLTTRSAAVIRTPSSGSILRIPASRRF